jgi:hypothetical protein
MDGSMGFYERSGGFLFGGLRVQKIAVFKWQIIFTKKSNQKSYQFLKNTGIYKEQQGISKKDFC